MRKKPTKKREKEQLNEKGKVGEISNHFRAILELIGEVSSREGLKGTPQRYAKMCMEIFSGYNIRNKPKITVFKNGQDGLHYNQLIIDEGEFYSMCEHHCMPFFGKYWFCYIPKKDGNILGLSKVARVVDYYSSKLQIQERLVQQIVDELWKVVEPEGMALVMKAQHMCKSMRGIKKDGQMITIEVRGSLKENPETRAEFLKFVNGNGGR